MLLNDCFQKRTFSGVKIFVCRGEIVHKSKSKEWYVHNSNPRQFIKCKKSQTKHLSSVYADFLLAITDLKSRYNLFINKPKKLSTIASLTIGDKVEVRLENQIIPASAAIRYIGPLDGRCGAYFGVEILVSECVCNSVFQILIAEKLHVFFSLLLCIRILYC